LQVVLVDSEPFEIEIQKAMNTIICDIFKQSGCHKHNSKGPSFLREEPFVFFQENAYFFAFL
jgi:hypothetical protein